MFDFTEIVVAAIFLVAAILGGTLAWAWSKWVKPWLVEHNLYATAEIVVHAVEAILGRHMGEEKWALAIKKMKDAGFNVDDARVLDALRAAWKKLDLSQIMAGEKEAPEDNT